MTDTKHPTKSKQLVKEDLVYFRFGQRGNGPELQEKVRAITAAKGATMASVIRDLIGRGLADYEAEKAILAAHKQGSAAAVGVGR